MGIIRVSNKYALNLNSQSYMSQLYKQKTWVRKSVLIFLIKSTINFSVLKFSSNVMTQNYMSLPETPKPQFLEQHKQNKITKWVQKCTDKTVER